MSKYALRVLAFFRKTRAFWLPAGLFWFGFVAGHGVAWAQTGMAPTAADWWTTLTTSGPLALTLGFILYRVDHERRELQKERTAILERVITGLKDATTSIQSIANTNNSLLTAFNSLSEIMKMDVLKGRDESKGS